MVAADQSPLLNAIIRAASDPAIDIEKMERLLAMHERMVAREAERSFNDAMSLAQEQLGPVARDADNPQTKSKYATYVALDRAIRPVYTKHGFSLSFDTGDATKPEDIRVLCYTGHRDGHSRTYHVDMPADGKGAKGGDVMTKTHATGAAMSYGQRYLLKLIFNIAVGEDRDGNRVRPVSGEPSPAAAKWIDAIKALADDPACQAWWKDNNEMLKKAPEADREVITVAFRKQRQDIQRGATGADENGEVK